MNKYRVVSRDISKSLEKKSCNDLKQNLDFCLKLNKGDMDFCYDMKYKYEDCLTLKKKLNDTMNTNKLIKSAI